MARLRQVNGQWVCDDVTFKGGKHCRGQTWGCEHCEGTACNFERNTGNTLCAICLQCDKPIEGAPFEDEFWVYGETSFCNEDCFNKEVTDTGDMLEQQELDEIYGDEDNDGS